MKRALIAVLAALLLTACSAAPPSDGVATASVQALESTGAPFGPK